MLSSSSSLSTLSMLSTLSSSFESMKVWCILGLHVFKVFPHHSLDGFKLIFDHYGIDFSITFMFCLDFFRASF